jgi:hypothetical protein
MAALTAGHASELDAVAARLTEVLGGKQATITQLRAELGATLGRLQQATDELLGAV